MFEFQQSLRFQAFWTIEVNSGWSSQAPRNLKNPCFCLVKPLSTNDPTYIDWMECSLSNGWTISIYFSLIDFASSFLFLLHHKGGGLFAKPSLLLFWLQELQQGTITLKTATIWVLILPLSHITHMLHCIPLFVHVFTLKIDSLLLQLPTHHLVQLFYYLNNFLDLQKTDYCSHWLPISMTSLSTELYYGHCWVLV